jgi:sulfotransferase famil protein
LSSEESLRALLAERDLEIRRLKVSYGRTFEELAAIGAVGGGAAYRFEELVAIRDGSVPSATVPPMVFVHLPKAGGTTLNHILMKNYRFRCDAYGADFFPRYYPDEFVALVQPPGHDDTRRPVFFTGHIDLSNEILHRMPVRYLATTMLRDPVERIVSHFRYQSTREDTPRHAEIRAGLNLPDYFRKYHRALPSQCAVFSPEKPNASDALSNLESRVSFFGLRGQFDEFVALLGSLAGLPDISYRPLNVTPQNAVDVPPEHIDQLRSLLTEDVIFYDGACQLYRSRIKALAEIRKPHPWTRFYAA